MAHLYGGNILLVDLSRGEITKEPTSQYTRSFLGGRGINIKLFYDHIQKGIDPLSAENILVFGVGPLGGTTLSSGRTEVTAKSPETGLLGSSNFGGFWGGELKYAGYDHIVIKGKADRPSYLWINNDQVEIRDAGAYWGKDAYQTQELIRQNVGNLDVKIACIGQAGENLVRFSTIQHELGNAAGRTGMGTVMGSKNLKAIVVRGTNQLTVADPEKFLDHAAQLFEIIKNHPECRRLSEEGVAPFQEEAADPDFLKAAVKGCNVDKMPSMLAIAKSQPSKRTGCQGCPVQCMELFQVDGVGKGAISCELYPEWSLVVGCHDTA
ncbi:MAG: aldehyde ferredoxin oxidoreductase, partial [Deltaproteobacteria bacterium]|nr:aldehyde ferredoxin oxidoreductase [Deltaproteobacteria bacterium]